MIGKLFSWRSSHPLADTKGLKRLIAELPLDNAFDAVDQVSGWLESLHRADDLPPDVFFEVLRQFDEAAQPHLERLAREYLNSSRRSRHEEGRLWTSNHTYWSRAADLYAQCVERFIDKPKERGTDTLRDNLPLISARLVAARAAQLKWQAYHYAPPSESLWSELGRAYLVADALGHANAPVRLYPRSEQQTDVVQQYLLALVLHASSLDSLAPMEIELASRLIEHFLPDFVFSADSRSDSVYWVDAAVGKPPTRLARQPQTITVSMRFFSPGGTSQALNELIADMAHGNLPAGLEKLAGADLGRQSVTKRLLPVLRHLARYWAAQPPLREHPRHHVKNPCSAVQGFESCYAALKAGSEGEHANAEKWLVENVSFGGFGAEVDCTRGDWSRLGALLCIQPDGAVNWVLCIVRRYGRSSETQARIGMQSLSRQAISVDLHLHSAGRAAASSFPGIWLSDNAAVGEARIVLPPGTFNAHQDLEFRLQDNENRRTVLTPIEAEESGGDFQIARYREQILQVHA